MKGSTEIRTRIVGFRVQSADHYTMEPYASLSYMSLLIDKVINYSLISPHITHTQANTSTHANTNTRSHIHTHIYSYVTHMYTLIRENSVTKFLIILLWKQLA